MSPLTCGSTYQEPSDPPQGKADLLFEREGEWRVVDFKTDRLDGPDSLRKHAEPKYPNPGE